MYAQDFRDMESRFLAACEAMGLTVVHDEVYIQGRASALLSREATPQDGTEEQFLKAYRAMWETFGTPPKPHQGPPRREPT
jgi:hypothetical protein